MGNERSAGYSALSCRSRVKILHLVQTRPQHTVAELVEATQLHSNTVREHLQRLIDGGHVVAHTEQRTSRGRPRTLFSAVDGTAPVSSPIAKQKVRDAAARGDIMRKVMPWTDTLDPTLCRQAVHQVDALVDHLHESGFDPVIDERVLRMDLRPCPHAATEPEHREVVCAAHLGIMRGVLAEAGGPLQVRRTHDAPNPTGCVVELIISGPVLTGNSARG